MNVGAAQSLRRFIGILITAVKCNHYIHAWVNNFYFDLYFYCECNFKIHFFVVICYIFILPWQYFFRTKSLEGCVVRFIILQQNPQLIIAATAQIKEKWAVTKFHFIMYTLPPCDHVPKSHRFKLFLITFPNTRPVIYSIIGVQIFQSEIRPYKYKIITMPPLLRNPTGATPTNYDNKCVSTRAVTMHAVSPHSIIFMKSWEPVRKWRRDNKTQTCCNWGQTEWRPRVRRRLNLVLANRYVVLSRD